MCRLGDRVIVSMELVCGMVPFSMTLNSAFGALWILPYWFGTEKLDGEKSFRILDRFNTQYTNVIDGHPASQTYIWTDTTRQHRRFTDTSAPGHFGHKTLRHLYLVPKCPGHFGTGAEVSSGRCSRLTARSLVAGPQAWNRLPSALRQLKTVLSWRRIVSVNKQLRFQWDLYIVE